MVILINGASSTGKTFIAQQILERYKITYYSIDHLKMGLYRGDKNCKFKPTDSISLISQHLAPILEGIIRTALENQQNLVLEGCYFDAESIRQIKKEYPNQLLAFSIVMSENYCQQNFDSTIKSNRNIIENRLFEEKRSLEEFIQDNKNMIDFSKKAGFRIFEIENQYQKILENVFLYLDEVLGKELELKNKEIELLKEKITILETKTRHLESK